jgi:hypothetical protein
MSAWRGAETTTATLEAPPNLPLTTKSFSHHITGRASSATQALKSLRLNLSVTTNTTITKKSSVLTEGHSWFLCHE